MIKGRKFFASRCVWSKGTDNGFGKACKKRFNFSKTSKTMRDKDALWGQKASAPPFWSKRPDKLDFNFCLQQISVWQCFEVGNNSVIVDDEFGHFANFCNQLECLSINNSIQTATFLKGCVVAMFYKKCFPTWANGYLNFLICLSHINCFLAFLDKISLFFNVNLFYCKPWRPGSRTPDLNKHEASQKATVPSSVIPKKLEMWRNLLSAYIWLFTTKKLFDGGFFSFQHDSNRYDFFLEQFCLKLDFAKKMF